MVTDPFSPKPSAGLPVAASIAQTGCRSGRECAAPACRRRASSRGRARNLRAAATTTAAATASRHRHRPPPPPAAAEQPRGRSRAAAAPPRGGAPAAALPAIVNAQISLPVSPSIARRGCRSRRTSRRSRQAGPTSRRRHGERPGQLQIGDVARVDLVQRRVARRREVAIDRPPVTGRRRRLPCARFCCAQHADSDATSGRRRASPENTISFGLP